MVISEQTGHYVCCHSAYEFNKVSPVFLAGTHDSQRVLTHPQIGRMPESLETQEGSQVYMKEAAPMEPRDTGMGPEGGDTAGA